MGREVCGWDENGLGEGDISKKEKKESWVNSRQRGRVRRREGRVRDLRVVGHGARPYFCRSRDRCRRR